MKYLLLLLLLSFPILTAHAQNKGPFTVQSPDGQVTVQVELRDKIYYSLSFKGQPLISPSPVSMTLQGGRVLGQNPRVRRSATSTTNQQLTPLYGQSATILDHFNELTLEFRDNYALVVRAYNDGAAYRFRTSLRGMQTITGEEATFTFATAPSVYAQLSKTFQTSYEELYTHRPLNQLPTDSMSVLPLLATGPGSVKVGITEADLYDYPALYLRKGTAPNTLVGAFPPYPLKDEPGGHNMFNLVVTETAPYIARTTGSRVFPWRVFILATQDAELLHSNLVYKLSRPAERGADFSWVKPGKVAWDWWHALNLKGVPFRAGFNTDTYKYYIDFAAANNIPYVNLDEGWSDQFDLLKLTSDLDMPALVAYAKEKNVGLILWVVARTLDAQLNEAMAQFGRWGISGIKVDFMDRDDQVMVNFYERIGRAAAKQKMLVNFHGAHKPTGMYRMLPNIINHEAVRGLEYNKFNKVGTTPGFAVTIPYTRMLAGYMDYTPGAMTNANRADYRTVNDRPMSQGTRAHQLAMYVLYYAPLQMLADAPTAYQQEPEILEFLSAVPTTWDETRPLAGEVAQYALIARRKGRDWYVGGLTSWDKRTVEVDFSFLSEGEYEADIYSDGINADRVGEDYRRQKVRVNRNSKQTIHLAPGGGVAIRVTPVQ